jgi:hypothetical protein
MTFKVIWNKYLLWYYYLLLCLIFLVKHILHTQFFNVLCSIFQAKSATIILLVGIKLLRWSTSKIITSCFARLKSLTLLILNTISQNLGISLSRTCNWRKKIWYLFCLTILLLNFLCGKIKSSQTIAALFGLEIWVWL